MHIEACLGHGSIYITEEQFLLSSYLIQSLLLFLFLFLLFYYFYFFIHVLHLAENNFIGHLPQQVCQGGKLVNFSAALNNFSDPIPIYEAQTQLGGCRTGVQCGPTRGEASDTTARALVPCLSFFFFFFLVHGFASTRLDSRQLGFYYH